MAGGSNMAWRQRHVRVAAAGTCARRYIRLAELLRYRHRRCAASLPRHVTSVTYRKRREPRIAATRVERAEPLRSI